MKREEVRMKGKERMEEVRMKKDKWQEDWQDVEIE